MHSDVLVCTEIKDKAFAREGGDPLGLSCSCFLVLLLDNRIQQRGGNDLVAGCHRHTSGLL